MSIATSNAWISNAMQMLMQTSTELYNNTINVALLTACIVREDEKRSYDPYEVVLGALLHDIGYAETINKSRGKSVDGMTAMEKLVFENHMRFGIDYIGNHISSQTVKDIIAMHHEYLDGSGFPAHLTWNGHMLELPRQMLYYRNGLSEDEWLSLTVDRILKKAEEEYENEPPGDYYREGYNLFLQLRKYKENELLFLHGKRVPANNSLCERLARVYKRKQKQTVTLRSQENLCYICDGLSVVYLLRTNEENVYHKISEIYGRRRPPKIKKEADAKV